MTSFLVDIVLISTALGLLSLGALHCLRNAQPSGWIMLMIILPIVGPVSYFLWFTTLARTGNLDNPIMGPVMTMKIARKRIPEIEERRASGILIPAETEELGRACLMLSRWEAAAEYLGEYLDGHGDGEHLRTRYFRAQALLQLERWKEAIEILQDIVSEEEYFDTGNALVLLARAFVGHGDPERAEMAYEIAISRAAAPHAVYELAMLKEQAGDGDGAIALLDKIIDMSRTAAPFQRVGFMRWARRARDRKTKLLEAAKRANAS